MRKRKADDNLEERTDKRAKLDTSDSDYVLFYSKSADKRAQLLSNFAEIELQIDDRIYVSGEHAFHGEKFLRLSLLDSCKRPVELQNHAKLFEGRDTKLKKPAQAKTAGGKSKKGLRLEADEIVEWNRIIAEQVQREICRFKFDHAEEIRSFLEESQGKVLVHQVNRANEREIWGGRISKIDNQLIGQNKLGKLWMELRGSNAKTNSETKRD
jgi:ribA/ribD-fused uncharacterized protein